MAIASHLSPRLLSGPSRLSPRGGSKRQQLSELACTRSTAEYLSESLDSKRDDSYSQQKLLPLAPSQTSTSKTPKQSTVRPPPGISLPRRSLFLGMSAFVLPIPVSAPMAGAQAEEASRTELKSEEKTRSLPLETLKEIIAADIRDRQYFVTGKMTKSIYRDDCFFIDPMNQVTGVDNYILGISLFLDPSCAYNELLGISTTEPNVVEAIWGLSGYFRYVPWQPYLSPIVGGTKYVFDDEGLVMRHEETWSISTAEAWRITLTPAFADKQKICKQFEGKTLPM